MTTPPRILLVGLSLFVGYNLVLRIPEVNRLYFGNAGQNEQNRVMAESIWDREPIFQSDDVVIVGSSLALRLPGPLLGPEVVNVSLNGGSMQTGLEMIRRSTATPRYVVIETNILMKPADDAFVTQVTHPAHRVLRQWFPSRKTRYRPANLLALQLIRRFVAPVTSWLKATPKLTSLDDPPHDAFRQGLLTSLRRDYSIEPAPTALATQVDHVAECVESLQSRGIDIIFLEMPIEAELAHLPHPTAIRQALVDRFPPAVFPWISPSSEQPFETTDGVHLNARSAQRYSQFVAQQLDQILHRSPSRRD